MKEKEMYKYIKAFFEERGYTVRAEVNDCDAIVIKDDMMIAVEMKTQLSVRLLAQGAERQKSFDLVYLAVPKPQYKKRLSKSFKQTLHIVRRLELGLLYIDTNGEGACTEEIAPMIFDRKKSMEAASSQRKRTDALEEFLARGEDYNTGGSVREEKVTAYRENALLIALYLMKEGAMSAKRLSELGCGQKARQIMYDNHYGWFERVSHGVYDVTAKGINAVKKYENVCKNLKKIMK